MKYYHLLISVLLITGSLKAQVLYPDDYTEDYYRLITLKNDSIGPVPMFIRPSVINEYSTDSALSWNIWGDYFNLNFKKNGKKNFMLLNPKLEYVYNYDYPRGYNDGPVWSGKGSNASFTAGFAGNYGILHYSFAPVVWFAQNQAFNIPELGLNKNEFSYPAEQNIDWVMRYGDDNYYAFDWGQSEVRLVYKNATVGFSTANFSWGPSRYNPIIMSKNAAGFPHVDVGTARPQPTKIGTIDFKWYWGALRESKYYDNDPDNDRGYITGFSLGYQPSLIKGLYFGLNRIMYRRWASGELATKDFFSAFIRNSHNGLLRNDDYDQMFSVAVEYKFPEVGLNVYLEYARNDFFGSLPDLAEHPDRTRASTIGLAKTFDLDNGKVLEFIIENTTLSSNQIQITSPGISATYYQHGVVESGYTHKGQIIGAGIGPGSNTGVFGFNLYDPKGKLGFTFQRIRFNDDYLVNAYPDTEDEPTDHEMALGFEYLRFFNNFSVNPRLVFAYRNNFLFQEAGAESLYFNMAFSYFINR